eukprot:TRINITY_DN8145_c0_g1_i2.p1 TRINITY_DN8145_c0_g1~~TRINITY_DN8145_c0_g1_i2.p1  ORF type:complete len:562 (+),score=27.05 TRINITY_DN8145_c0_g1_i2:111-1796(+)
MSAQRESAITRMARVMKAMRSRMNRTGSKSKSSGTEGNTTNCSAIVTCERRNDSDVALHSSASSRVPAEHSSLEREDAKRESENSAEANQRQRRRRSRSSSSAKSEAEKMQDHCRLRASRGHLFEHFCRDAIRSHAPLFGRGDHGEDAAAQEIQVELADFAFRLRRPIPVNQLLPSCFEIDSADMEGHPDLPAGVVVVEVKQNVASVRHGLKQLETRLSKLEEPASATVLLASFSASELNVSGSSFRRHFRFDPQGRSVPLIVARAHFNEAAWAQRLVAQSERSRLDDAVSYSQSHPSSASSALALVGRPGERPRRNQRSRGRVQNAERDHSQLQAESNLEMHDRCRRHSHDARNDYDHRCSPGASRGSRGRPHSRQNARSSSAQLHMPEVDVLVGQSVPCANVDSHALPPWLPCHAEACQNFHWPDLRTGEASRCCQGRKCARCHCGYHVWSLSNATLGAVSDATLSFRVWLLGPVSTQEGVCVVDFGGRNGESYDVQVCWHVSLVAREVQLLRRKLHGVANDQARWDIIARPEEGTFYVCNARSRIPQRRRLPSASRER